MHIEVRFSNKLYFRVGISFPVMMKVVGEMAVLVVVVFGLLLQVLTFCLVCIVYILILPN